VTVRSFPLTWAFLRSTGFLEHGKNPRSLSSTAVPCLSSEARPRRCISPHKRLCVHQRLSLQQYTSRNRRTRASQMPLTLTKCTPAAQHSRRGRSPPVFTKCTPMAHLSHHRRRSPQKCTKSIPDDRQPGLFHPTSTRCMVAGHSSRLGQSPATCMRWTPATRPQQPSFQGGPRSRRPLDSCKHTVPTTHKPIQQVHRTVLGLRSQHSHSPRGWSRHETGIWVLNLVQ
jgi:hypothetical protein